MNDDSDNSLRNLSSGIAESFLEMSDEALDNYIQHNPKELNSALKTKDLMLKTIKGFKKDRAKNYGPTGSLQRTHQNP